MSDFFNVLRKPSFWLDVSLSYGFAALVILLDANWWRMLLFAGVTAIIAVVQLRKEEKKNSEAKKIKEIEKALKCAKKAGDRTKFYEILDKQLLPTLRTHLPKTLYKYYPLKDDEYYNKRQFCSLEENNIWASTPSQFNDPFEFQYVYMGKDEFAKMGFPQNAKRLWDDIMGEFNRRVTTICFTKNPNAMPMWAHYANEHRGFCVEYTVTNKNHLYPVCYMSERTAAQGLFVQLAYILFNKDVSSEEKRLTLQYVLFLNSFKDKSWESENEVRAIFLNPLSDTSEKGRLFTLNEIGVSINKIYIGAACSNENKSKLVSIAKDKGIGYEICHVSDGNAFTVIN